MKCLALCRASTTARHSPSVGEYLLSEGLINLPPARTSFQPSLQHLGCTSLQSHHFCSKKNPIPAFDQSHARHVGLLISKCWTPSFTASTIFSLALTKLSCNAG